MAKQKIKYDRSHQLKIVKDYENRTIYVGNYASLNQPHLTPESKASVLSKNNIKIYDNHVTRQNVKFYSKGCFKRDSVYNYYLGPKFKQRYMAACYDVYIKNCLPEIKTKFCKMEFGHSFYMFDFKKVSLVDSAKEHIEQALSDGQYNIIPFIIERQKSAHEIKLEMGKGLWKSIIKNSKSKNILIARLFAKAVYSNILEKREVYRLLNSLKSSLLKNMLLDKRGIVDYHSFRQELTEINKQSVTSKDFNFFHIIRHYEDLKRMARIYNQPYNSKWSVKRAFAEHDRLSRMSIYMLYNFPDGSVFSASAVFEEKLLKKYPNGIINLKDHIENSRVYKIRLDVLKSKKDYIDEGEAMKHCIASYMVKAYEGEYITIHLSLLDSNGNPEDDKNLHSTLGIEIDDDIMSIQQHYSIGNSSLNPIIKRAESIIKNEF